MDKDLEKNLNDILDKYANEIIDVVDKFTEIINSNMRFGAKEGIIILYTAMGIAMYKFIVYTRIPKNVQDALMKIIISNLVGVEKKIESELN